MRIAEEYEVCEVSMLLSSFKVTIDRMYTTTVKFYDSLKVCDND
jgi:hypothetical protein